MKKLLLLMVAGCFFATPAQAQVTCCYGWEDCGVLLGMYPAEGVIAHNVITPVHSGDRALRIIDNAASGTPQAFVGWVTGLTDGDVVTACFWRYDDTPGASPSVRIWTHYTVGDDPSSYAGSGGGNDDYGPGEGWDETCYTLNFDSSGGTRDGIMIEARTYSNAGDTVWVDDICITFPSREGVCCHFPTAGPTAVESASWGAVKTLFR